MSVRAIQATVLIVSICIGQSKRNVFSKTSFSRKTKLHHVWVYMASIKEATNQLLYLLFTTSTKPHSLVVVQTLTLYSFNDRFYFSIRKRVSKFMYV